MRLLQESYQLSPKAIIRLWVGRALLRLRRFDESREILEESVKQYSWVHRELGWLHEQEKNLAAAIRSYEECLKHYPDDERSKQAIVRLKAALLSPEALLEEVELQKQFGDKPQAHLIPLYIERLLELGQGVKARSFLAEYVLPSTQTIQVAWTCFKARAYDLSFDFFRKSLEHLDFKGLNAFEKSAEKCARVGEAISDYSLMAPQNKRLYGRIINLKKLLGG